MTGGWKVSPDVTHANGNSIGSLPDQEDRRVLIVVALEDLRLPIKATSCYETFRSANVDLNLKKRTTKLEKLNKIEILKTLTWW